jgi:hypothetical protein
LLARSACRKGKHNLIVSMILDDLDKVDLERAVLVL